MPPKKKTLRPVPTPRSLSISSHTSKNAYDNWETPCELFKTLSQVLTLPRGWVIEDPFVASGASGRFLRMSFVGHRVIHRRTEFFANSMNQTDVVIGAPPFSASRDVMRRLMEKKKPFAILVWSDVLHDGWFYDMFKEEPYRCVFVPGHRHEGVVAGHASTMKRRLVWVIWKVPCRIRNQADCPVLRK